MLPACADVKLVHPDPNTGDTIYESDAIVRHLYQEYGGGIDNIPKVMLRSVYRV